VIRNWISLVSIGPKFFILEWGPAGRKPFRNRFLPWRDTRSLGFTKRVSVDRKPCVLIIVENLPAPLDRRVWQESQALRDAGYEVVIICPKMRGYHTSAECIDGIWIYRHWISEEAGGLIGFFGEYASALFGEIRLAWNVFFKHRFRVIHLCNPPDLLFLVAAPFRALGVRVVYDVHDVWPEMFEAKFGRRNPLYWAVRLAERATYAVANVALATNESVRAIALRRGSMRPEDVFVVRTAPKIPTDRIEARPELKKGRTYLVGYVGVMGDADGVNFVLEAARYLVYERGRKDIQFLLMGSGPEYDRLVRLRRELELEEYVDMPGRVSNEDLFAGLKTMDVGVASDPINAYNNHCTMNKTLEYMAFGKPQVMFDIAEGRASAGDAAFYVSETSGPALGAGLETALDSPDQRAEMGRLGRERLRNELNWERSVENLLAGYERVLRAPSNGR